MWKLNRRDKHFGQHGLVLKIENPSNNTRVMNLHLHVKHVACVVTCEFLHSTVLSVGFKVAWAELEFFNYRNILTHVMHIKYLCYTKMLFVGMAWPDLSVYFVKIRINNINFQFALMRLRLKNKLYKCFNLMKWFIKHFVVDYIFLM